MIRCDEAIRRLWEYLDEDLRAADHHRVAAHLELCRRCCGEAEFIVELRALLRRLPSPGMPVGVEEQLVEFLVGLEHERP